MGDAAVQEHESRAGGPQIDGSSGSENRYIIDGMDTTHLRTGVSSKTVFIDFLQAFGKERGEYVAGYAVAYIVADEEMKVTLSVSSNDQGKAWVNGKEVFRFAETRTLEKDTERADVLLLKGQNVLVFKVINEVNNWQACARFVKNGAPVKNIKISLPPQ